jgi:hypothetical protein
MMIIKSPSEILALPIHYDIGPTAGFERLLENLREMQLSYIGH